MLNTVADFIRQSRVLLQDTLAPYRYADEVFIEALNNALMEAFRLRPDLFIGRAVPAYDATTDEVAFDPRYRYALMLNTTGLVLLSDTEAADIEKASAFMTKFTATLITGQA